MKIICPEHKGLIEVPDESLMHALKRLNQTTVLVCPECSEQIFIHNVWIGDQPPSFPMKRSLVYREHKWYYTNNFVG